MARDKTIAQAAIELAADMRQWHQSLKDLPRDFEKRIKPLQRRLRKFGRQLGSVGKDMSKAVTGPLAALGAASFASAVKVDDALKTIQIGTRASEEAMVGLGETFRNVMRKTPADIEQAAGAIADLNTLTGATGPVLERMATGVLEASRMLGESGAENAGKFGRFLRQWGIDAADAGPKIDGLFKLTQDFGIGLGDLLKELNKYAPVMINAGFSSEQTAEFMARLHSSGIAVSRVMPGINKAFRTWAESGLDLQRGLDLTVEKIKNAKTNTEALTIATNVFGAEGAQRMMTAIRNGTIELGNLGNALKGAEGTIEASAEATMKFGDRLTLLKNNAMLAFEPIGVQLLGAFEKLMPHLLKGAEFVAGLANKFADLDPKTQALILGIGGLAAAIGPMLIALGSVATTIAGLLGAFPLLGTAIAALAAPVTAIIAALTSWGVVIYQVVDNWEILKTGTLEILGRIGTAIADFVKAAIDDVKGMYKVGEAAVEGLWEGIQNKLEWLKSKTKELGEAIPDTLKKVLGISSPAKATMEVGEEAAYGLVEGYDKGVKGPKGLNKVMDEHLKLMHGKYGAMIKQAEKTAEELLNSEEINAEQRKQVREWLKLKKEEIAKAEADNEKKEAERAARDAERILEERKRKWEEYVGQEGTFAEGFKLGLDKMHADLVSWGDVGETAFNSITSGFDNVMGSFVNDLWTGQLKSASDYFDGFVQDILGQVANMITKMAAQQLTSALFGGLTEGGGGLLSSLIPGGGGDGGGPGLLGAGGITDKLGFGEGIMGGIGAGIAVTTVAASAANIYKGIKQASGARDLAGENRAFAEFLQGLGLLSATAERWGGFIDMDKGLQLVDELQGFEDLLPAVKDFATMFATQMKEADLAKAAELREAGLGEYAAMVEKGAGLNENQVNQLVSQMLFSFKDAGMDFVESATYMQGLMSELAAEDPRKFAWAGVHATGLERLAALAESGDLGKTINQTNNITVTGLDVYDLVMQTANEVEQRLLYADRG